MQYAINKIKDNRPNWSIVSSLLIDKFPWYKTGEKQDTHVKLVANDSHLFIQIVAQDKHSFAKQTQLNHPLICQDSCVEFFFSPSGVLGSRYINLEVNCCGTLHIAFGASRTDRLVISPEIVKLLQCQSSLNTRIKTEHEDDSEWSIEITIPFIAIEQLSGEKINKALWYANFYRCGGRKEPQFGTWHNITLSEPDFHQPWHFGQLSFES